MLVVTTWNMLVGTTWHCNYHATRTLPTLGTTAILPNYSYEENSFCNNILSKVHSMEAFILNYFLAKNSEFILILYYYFLAKNSVFSLSSSALFRPRSFRNNRPTSSFQFLLRFFFNSERFKGMIFRYSD